MLLIAVGWWFTQTFAAIAGPQNAATAFLSSNGSDGPSVAYRQTSATFQLSTSEPTWVAYSQQYQLEKYYAADWNQFQTSGDSSSLHGIVKRTGLPDLQAQIDLRRVDTVWKVVYVQMTGPTGLISSSGTGVGPSPGDLGAGGGGAPVGSGDVSQPTGVAGPAAPLTVPQPAPQSTIPLGRSGPPGTVVASGQVGPTCMSPLWSQGFRADSVKCPLYLNARPGETEICSAHSIDGRYATVRVTYLDYDPVTRLNKIDCRIN